MTIENTFQVDTEIESKKPVATTNWRAKIEKVSWKVIDWKLEEMFYELIHNVSIRLV